MGSQIRDLKSTTDLRSPVVKPQTECQTAILKLALHGGRKATAPDLTGEADNHTCQKQL